MKKIIVVVGFIILGVFIYGLLIGDNDGTVKTESKKVMEKQIQGYKIVP